MTTSGGSIGATVDVDGGRGRINVEDVHVTDDGKMNEDDVDDDDSIVVDVGETSHDETTARAAAAATAAAAAVAAAIEAAAAAVTAAPPERDWQYNAEALRAALSSISTSYKAVEVVEKAVKEVCAEHGTRLARSTSKKGQRGRLILVGLRCVHGMRNRQGERKGKAPGNTGHRKYVSQRSGCGFKVSINRWQLRYPNEHEEYEHPRLTAMNLNHNHPVEEPLPSRVKAEVAKLTDAGVAPAVQVRVLNALHNCRVSPRAVQEASSLCVGAKRPYDAQESHTTEKGPTAQDRQLLHVDMLKEVTTVVSKAVETLPPDTVRMLVAQFGENMRTAARVQSEAGRAMGNPDAVCLPTGAGSGERNRPAGETRRI